MSDPEQGIMIRFEREAHSFVIRIWRENRETEGDAAEWRGWITHVQSRQRHYFRDLSEIKPIVNRYLNGEVDLEGIIESVPDQKDTK